MSEILLGDFDADGTKVGASDGDCVGTTARPGASVGLTVGATDISNGADVGALVGVTARTGASVGLTVGATDISNGADVGASDG